MEGWAEKAQICSYFVSLLSSLLNKICILFLGEGQPGSSPNSPECGRLGAPECGRLGAPKPSSARQLHPGWSKHRRERELAPLAQLKHFILFLGLKTLI